MTKTTFSRTIAVVLMLSLLLLGGCSGEGATRDECGENCSDGLAFFDCVEGSVIRECTDACTVEPISLVDDFNACIENSGGCGDVACLSILGVDAEGRETNPNDDFNRDRCKDGCNEVTSCSSADETSDCLAACDSVPGSDAGAFASCVNITKSCEENRLCYTTLGL